jgi:chromosome segregation ATPase
LQMAKLNHATILDEREQEIDKLTAQLEHHEESRKAILSQHSEEKAQLQQSLEESQTSLMVAENTIRTLKRDRESIRESKSEADEQLTQLKAESQKKEAELIAAFESSQQEATSLRQELADTKKLITKPEEVEHLRQTLQQTVDEKAALKRERNVQEVAVEMLSADLDALAKEKALLVDERDRLHKELSDIRSQRKVDTTQNNSDD